MSTVKTIPPKLFDLYLDHFGDKATFKLLPPDVQLMAKKYKSTIYVCTGEGDDRFVLKMWLVTRKIADYIFLHYRPRHKNTWHFSSEIHNVYNVTNIYKYEGCNVEYLIRELKYYGMKAKRGKTIMTRTDLNQSSSSSSSSF
jgi:hypothetical protein